LPPKSFGTAMSELSYELVNPPVEPPTLGILGPRRRELRIYEPARNEWT
jgi:hypothetical protein